MNEIGVKLNGKFDLSTGVSEKDERGKFNQKDIGSSLHSLGIRNGDMIWMHYSNSDQKKEKDVIENNDDDDVIDDEIDLELYLKDGWIKRDRDRLKCNHPSNGSCLNCMPISPWSILEYDPWKSNGLKYLPFHSFIRKKRYIAPCSHGNKSDMRCIACKMIDDFDFSTKECKNHFPFPAGICSDCKPDSCRINSQDYRHVDHVEFENMAMIDSFLQYWRDTGEQRCGYLYGKYVPDERIPLGIRCLVALIYEPEQKDGVDKKGDRNQNQLMRADWIADQWGLRRVGFIWTDLRTDPVTRALKCTRSPASPLTSREIYRIGKMQAAHPNPCSVSKSGVSGSKFVSVLVSASLSSEVELSAYQVSDQCQALVRDGIVVASKKGSLLRVKNQSESAKAYIPEIFYRKKDDYGNQVEISADPTFPSEFCIVTLGHSAPIKPSSTFKSCSFPKENRLTRSQKMDDVETFFRESPQSPDFHLLFFLCSHFDQPTMTRLCEAYRTGKSSTVSEIFSHLPLGQKRQPPVSHQPVVRRTVPPITQQRRPAPQRQSEELQKRAKEEGMINQLVQMGYTHDQAKQALWAVSFSSIEAAMDLLLQ